MFGNRRKASAKTLFVGLVEDEIVVGTPARPPAALPDDPRAVVDKRISEITVVEQHVGNTPVPEVRDPIADHDLRRTQSGRYHPPDLQMMPQRRGLQRPAGKAHAVLPADRIGLHDRFQLGRKHADASVQRRSPRRRAHVVQSAGCEQTPAQSVQPTIGPGGVQIRAGDAQMADP